MTETPAAGRPHSIRMLSRRMLHGAASLLTVAALAGCSGQTAQPAAKVAAVAEQTTGEPANDATPRRLRLITSEQYLNTLDYIFGPDIKPDTRFAPLVRTDGLLESGAASAGVTDGQLEQYQRVATQVAAQVVSPGNRNFLVPCKPKNEKAADTACATKFIANVGRLLFRRPLTPEKIHDVVGEANTAADRLKDFYNGLAVAFEGLLLSPNMLLVKEKAEPDPQHPGHQRLDGYSLASRLSFFLWNAAPDDALLKAAQSGELETDAGRARIVDMMLASPRLVAGMRAFFDDMLGFDDFNNLAKDPMVYPSFTGVTVQDAREQTLRTVIDHL